LKATSKVLATTSNGTFHYNSLQQSFFSDEFRSANKGQSWTKLGPATGGDKMTRDQPHSSPALVARPFVTLGSVDRDGNHLYRAYFIADFVWHTAMTAELAKEDPRPRNPFLATERVHYYWTYFRVPATLAARTRIGIENALKLNALATALLLIAAIVDIVSAEIRWQEKRNDATACRRVVTSAFPRRRRRVVVLDMSSRVLVLAFVGGCRSRCRLSLSCLLVAENSHRRPPRDFTSRGVFWA
jgi:hypothetical protein